MCGDGKAPRRSGRVSCRVRRGSLRSPSVLERHSSPIAPRAILRRPRILVASLLVARRARFARFRRCCVDASRQYATHRATVRYRAPRDRGYAFTGCPGDTYKRSPRCVYFVGCEAGVRCSAFYVKVWCFVHCPPTLFHRLSTGLLWVDGGRGFSSRHRCLRLRSSRCSPHSRMGGLPRFPCLLPATCNSGTHMELHSVVVRRVYTHVCDLQHGVPAGGEKTRAPTD